jgi:tRNA(Arg) A34 adenosine deaminase TadA
VTIELPSWVGRFCVDSAPLFRTLRGRVRFAIELSRRNVENGTGGPFGAAVFDRRSHRLLAPGVNLVLPLRCSVAHAEMVAIMIAQQKVGHYDLGSAGTGDYELVSSTEPCAMCMGAIPWSGVRRLVCAARGEDACRVGLDEGAKPARWVSALESRGVAVVRDVCRREAAGVLTSYRDAGGVLYNGRAWSRTRSG